MADREDAIRELIDELIKQKGDCIIADEKYSILSFVLDALIKKRKEEFLQSLGIDTGKPDREKVIKCLEACTGVTDDCAGHTCPYWDFDDSATDWGCRIQMEKDALALLKEQEAVVRCKDCKYWLYESYCDKYDKGQENADWFCAGGERREDE